MKPTEPRLHAALDAAMNQIRSTATAVATRLCESLGTTAANTTALMTRDMVSVAQNELRRGLPAFRLAFQDSLREKVNKEVSARGDARRKAEFGSWQTLTLVEDSEVEERMNFERIGQTISHACEWQLRELAAYMGAITGLGRADEDRNPLRSDVVGAALYRGIEAITENADSRKILAREFGFAMAESMPECYEEILRNLQERGVKPVGLMVRTVEGPGNQLPGVNSGYMGVSSSERTSTRGIPADSGLASGHGDEGVSYARGGGGGGSGGTTSRGSGGPSTGLSSGAEQVRSMYSNAGSTEFDGRGGSRQRTTSPADAQLMTLLRRLTAVASHAGEFNDVPVSNTYPAPVGDASPNRRPAAAESARAGLAPAPGDELTGLMAVNLIRAHQDELIQASSGKLDHMVIEVVGSLFDQILSDARVPPQM
ncbi:MAG: DUF1631 family protein, partial [Caldimonas sp.]